VVVDLGAGTGIMSCLAVQLGASTVYAIDPSDTLQVARTIARANHVADRIQFFHVCSQTLTLPERADVIVTDLRGVLPAFGGHFLAIADARERFLKPDGILIPRRDTVWAALVTAPDAYAELVGGWVSGGLDLSAGRRMVLNNWIKQRVTPAQLLTRPAQWAAIDYATVTTAALAGQLETEVQSSGTAHGLSLWFDTSLFEDIGFSNAPGEPELIYGQAFFPLSEPVPVECGDRVKIALRADLTGEDYTWGWNTRIESPSGLLKADHKQSTFKGIPFPTDNIRKSADTYVPSPTEDAIIDRTILNNFGSKRTLHDIAIDLASQFPDRFKDWKEAQGRIAQFAIRYCA
jgi:protein arginine N-methyltransferase 1